MYVAVPSQPPPPERALDLAFSNDPALTVAVALAAGVLGQIVAHHLRIPGIVLLLLLGVVLGPDVLDVVRPRSIGDGLPMLVELAVAVILFEGGLSLDLRQIRRQAGAIRGLITTGALVTAVGATVVARTFQGWDWPIAILFGTLVIVTGPTVITPLLRRIRVKKKLHTILEAEGVLIDPIGAVIAVVALEVIVTGVGGPAAGSLDVLLKLGVGIAAGAVGGLLISLLLRNERLVPEALQNILTLSMALAVFELSNALQPESGIMAVVAAGVVVANLSTGVKRELIEFKEQLTVMLVGMLFVLLAADVRVADVRSVGTAGVMTIALLMFVVRPLTVAAGTVGSGLPFRDKAFLSWLSPRGIVAAAVASLFAQTMAEHGMAGGPELRALVFMVIAGTVVVQGLTGGLVAGLLGVRRPQDDGYVIVGAGPLGRALAGVLTGAEHNVVLIDRNPLETRVAQEQGFSVVFGDATDENVLLRADIECRRGLIALTSNDAVNLLVAQNARELARHVRTLVALTRGGSGVGVDRVIADGHHLLFGEAIDMERWNHDLLRDAAQVTKWVFRPAREGEPDDQIWLSDRAGSVVLALATAGRRQTLPVDEEVRVKQGEALLFCTLADQKDRTLRRLSAAGWEEVPMESDPADAVAPP